MKRIVVNASFCVLMLLGLGKPSLQAQDINKDKIWYTAPADASVTDKRDPWKNDKEWLKALPIGNGSLGAMVFGDVNQERIQLNELSLWSGSVQEGDNPDAPLHLAKIRELLFQGKYKEATELTNRTQITKGRGSSTGAAAEAPFGCYQTMGDLHLDFKNKGSYEDYRRELDLMTGVVTTSFKQNGTRFKREVFASHPDQVIVIRLSADAAQTLSFDLTMDRAERFTTTADGHSLVMQGALNDGNGGDGMRYKTVLTAKHTGGEVAAKGNSLEIRNADEVVLILAAKTNHKLSYPMYTNTAFEKELDVIVAKSRTQSYKKLKSRHIADFSKYMKRVDFQLGEKANDIPTDQLIAASKDTGNKDAYYSLYFQYGRYLLLASSRDGGLPSNLQGIWANQIQTPWNGDYHTNINVQMNYWPAEVTNLSESHLPLVDLIESLMEPGKKTAATQYGMNGWALHVITNVWGYTSPGESATWGMHIGGGAWMVQHVWDHYAFTQDKAYLKRVYPILKQASLFYLDWLVTDPKTGKLISGPSPSPENTFKAPDGSIAQISMGPAHDQQVIFNLFSNTLAAADILGLTEDKFVTDIRQAKDSLLPSKIAKDGRLMEWAEEFEEVEPKHRHLSHLFAFYPGNEITLVKTPELAKAVERSLEVRGDDGVGWTYGWKIALWARLQNGDRAFKILDKQLIANAYTNLFNAGPPFQIEGNFGVVAGMAEMLLQSHEDYIELLPALPTAWKDGKIDGLVARGGVVIDMAWQAGRLVDAYAKARHDGTFTIKYGDQLINVTLKAGKRTKLKIN